MAGLGRASSASWRAADLRGDGPVPSSVGAIVRRTWLALFAARWGESALFLAAGALVTLAAAELSLPDPDAPGRYPVALLAGLCAGLAWGLEHRMTQRTVARRLDRRLRHGGALVTAWELETRARHAPEQVPGLASLLRVRVLERLRLRDALRAIHPPLAVPLAAPLLAAGLLFVARETRRAGVEPPPALGSLSERGAALVSEAWLDALDTELDLEDRRGTMKEFAAVERELRDLARRAPDGEGSEGGEGREEGAERPGAVADWMRELEALDARLAELSARLAEAPEVVSALDGARTSLDAARMAAEQASATPPATAGDAEPDPQTVGGLVAGAESGTITGSPATSTGAPDASAGSDRGAAAGAGPGARPGLPEEVGAGAGRWWEARHDAVVERWIELRRQALAAGDETE